MDNKEKTPEQIRAEKLERALVMSDAISYFNLKLTAINNDTPIEKQIKYLSDYHDILSIEEIKSKEYKIDSYRKEFMDCLYKKYFEDFPEMLEKLHDKKTDNDMANFYGLRLLSYLFKASETDKSERKKQIEAYYDILPKYHDFLNDYIVNNQRWDLTINTKEAFLAYYEIEKEHDILLQKYSSPLDISCLIRDVSSTLVDKIAKLKELGIDDDTYRNLVSNVVIGKFRALRFLMNEMAGGGANVLEIVSGVVFDKWPIHDVYGAAAEVEYKLTLTEEQKEQMAKVNKMLEYLGINGLAPTKSSGTGCMLILLLLMIPASIFTVLF